MDKNSANVYGIYRENIDLGFLAFIKGKHGFFTKCVDFLYRVDTRFFLYGPYRNLYNSYSFFLERGPLDD